MSWLAVRASAARIPRELATATVSTRRRERAVGGDAGRVGGRDHRPHTLGAQLRGRRGRAVGKRAADGVGSGRARAGPIQSGVSSTRSLIRPAVSASRAEGVAVGSPGGRDADPLAAHEAQVDPDVGLGHVLVDLRVGEARERGVRRPSRGPRPRSPRPPRHGGGRPPRSRAAAAGVPPVRVSTALTS